MNNILICKCEPGKTPVIAKAPSGTRILISDAENIVNVGDKYKDYPAIISEVFYSQKKWWQFWKRKQQLGYSVTLL